MMQARCDEMTVDAYTFGEIRINGERFTSDVIIWPGHVTCPWWRARGHALAAG